MQGGDPAVNRYLDWVSAEVKRDYAIDLRIVHIADAAGYGKAPATEARRAKHRFRRSAVGQRRELPTLKTASLLPSRMGGDAAKLALC